MYNIQFFFVALSQLNGDTSGGGSGIDESSSKNATKNSTISGDDDKTSIENININQTEGKTSFPWYLTIIHRSGGGYPPVSPTLR